MKKPVHTDIWNKLIFPIAIVLIFASCKEQPASTTRTYHIQKAISVKVSDIRKMSTTSSTPRQLSVSGKIYVYGNYLFINEPRTGIHVVDNSNPYYPRFINFISIPGNVDMAVNSNVLYADSYIDLLAFDISNPRNIRLVKRVEDVFPGLYIDQAKTVCIAYKDTVITEVITDGTNGRPGSGMFWEFGNAFLANASQSYGQGGSMARFTLMNDHLYTVNNYELRLFNVSAPAEPRFVNTIRLNWGIETIFPFENKLFIGSTTGMHIYDASTASAPKYVSTYRHFTSCDPVVVSGKHAFVTLRSGNFCQQGVNQLDVLNIEDVYNPKLVKSYPMQNPHGLGISASNLYVCEGEYGLKSYDISDVLKIDNKQLQHLKNIKAIDVIPAPKSLIVTGPNGIYQFDCKIPGRLRQLSRIAIKEIEGN